MAGRKHRYPVFIILFFIVSAAVAVCVLYYTKTFKALNEFIDRYFAEKPVRKEIITEFPSLTGARLRNLYPSFAGRRETVLRLDEFSRVEESQGIRYTVEDSGYLLSCSRALKSNAPQGYPVAVFEKIWEYRLEFPIVSKPVLFADSLVFITAEPKLHCVSIETGSLLSSCESPVFPGTAALADDAAYLFLGRDGNIYGFEFGKDDKSSSVSGPAELAAPLSQKYDIPDAYRMGVAVWESMKRNLETWLPGYEGDGAEEFEASLYPAGNNPFPVGDADFNVLVFSPEKQQTYTVGLSDEAGLWISARAAVAVFTSEGDMLQTSLDYVADRPQVTLPLSDSDVYYIIVCTLDGEKTLAGSYALIKATP